MVLLVLFFFTDSTGAAWPTEEQVADLAGMSASTVRANLALLHRAGLVWTITPAPSERGKVAAQVTYTDEKGAAAIRALFALGLFKDVRLETQGDVLVVVVEERPSVAAVEFIGLKEFDKDVLTKALKEVGLAEGRPYDKALADKAEQELKRQYISRSLYGAQVVTTATPIDRNRVNLSFNVTEGEVAKIKEMAPDIVGLGSPPEGAINLSKELKRQGVATRVIGGTTIAGGTITTSGSQTYSHAVTLGDDATLTGHGINFAARIDGAKSLTIVDGGATVFNGAIGNTTALTSLTVDSANGTAINGGSVRTTGSQTYNDAVTLGVNTTLTGSDITLASMVDGATGTSVSLTIADSGATVLGGAIGSTTDAGRRPRRRLAGQAWSVHPSSCATSSGRQGDFGTP